MRHLLAILNVLILLFGLYSCSWETYRPTYEAKIRAAELWANPEPLPPYLIEIRVGQKSMCMEIDFRFFTGESMATFGITSNTGIRLDEVMERMHFNLNGSPRNDWVDAGDSRGSFYECYSIRHLTSGLHLASMTLTDFFGGEDSYEWAFRVNDTAEGFALHKIDERVVLPVFPE